MGQFGPLFLFQPIFYLCIWVCVIEVIIIHINFMFFMLILDVYS